jgi:hypothetical protein
MGRESLTTLGLFSCNISHSHQTDSIGNDHKAEVELADQQHAFLIFMAIQDIGAMVSGMKSVISPTSMHF